VARKGLGGRTNTVPWVEVTWESRSERIHVPHRVFEALKAGSDAVTVTTCRGRWGYVVVESVEAE
jgi:hypothetical protein